MAEAYQHSRKKLALARRWCEALSDDESGFRGARLKQLLLNSGCTEGKGAETSLMSPAAYSSFAYDTDTHASLFINRIDYDRSKKRSVADFLVSHIHESIHALQWNTVAALHASPYNANSPYVLCPRDWILMMRRTEEDAYVKQAWLSSLEKRHAPQVSKATRSDPLSADEFKMLRTQSSSLQDAFTKAARCVLAKQRAPGPDGKIQTFADYYDDFALDAYEAMLMTRFGNGQPVIFVRLGPEDVHEIGNTLGLPTFGPASPEKDFSAAPALSDKNEKRLAVLNAQLGITNDAALPAFAAALQKEGLTRVAFLARSRASRPVIGPAT